MALVIDATIGGSAANSYETLAEAQAYFDARLPLSGWDDADSQDVLLAMATRLLEGYANSLKQLVTPAGGVPAYYKVGRRWTGSPATKTQKLSWPRTGMFDVNGYPLDTTFANTVASPTVLTTATPHRRTSGDQVLVFNSTSTPNIDGARTITVIDETSFSIPVAVTVEGIGSVAFMPQELKDAEAEFAGQLGIQDLTLNNDVIVQGLTSVKAGSVALTFKNQIFAQVVPDAVLNLLLPGWLTDEGYEPALAAQFDMMSHAPHPHRGGRW